MATLYGTEDVHFVPWNDETLADIVYTDAAKQCQWRLTEDWPNSSKRQESPKQDAQKRHKKDKGQINASTVLLNALVSGRQTCATIALPAVDNYPAIEGVVDNAFERHGAPLAMLPQMKMMGRDGKVGHLVQQGARSRHQGDVA